MSDDVKTDPGVATGGTSLSQGLATTGSAVGIAQLAAQVAGVSSSGLDAAGQGVGLAQSAISQDGLDSSLLGGAGSALGMATALGATSPAVQTASKAVEGAQAAWALTSKFDKSSASTSGAASGATAATSTSFAYVGSSSAAATAPVLNQQIQQHVFSAKDASSSFDDEHRLLRLYSSLPEEKRLFVHTLEGHEALNELFEFRVELVSRSDEIELKELMGKPLVVGIRQTDGGERLVSGYVREFAMMRNNVKGWAVYAATLVPWTYILTMNQDSRCVTDKTVRQVIEDVLRPYGRSARYEFRLTGSYEPQDFIVQYQQSDWAFVSYLIEREGWTTTYEHGLDGQLLVITDDTVSASACPPLPVYPTIEFNGEDRVLPNSRVKELHAVRELQPTQFTLDTFDYKSPRTPRLVQMPTNADQGDVPSIEVFDGTPGYAFKNRSEGDRYARIRIEEREAKAKRFQGISDCPDLRPGGTTLLTGHPQFRQNQKDRLLVTRVEHRGRNDVFGDAEDGPTVYANSFHCMRQKVPYRPPLVHPRAVIPGTQTAIVTGPPGHEIWTNKAGCVTVRFHWDRRARFDSSSSCWIRVAQAWAGAGWGTVSIPRVGQEVLVGFMEGNPDRPVVLGSLYNQDQPPPYALPDGAHMMGFKSNSTPGGGGHSEMVIHDSKGSELVNIHAQKDMVTTVLNEHHTTVQGPQQVIDVTTGVQKTTVAQDITVESKTGGIGQAAKTAIVLTAGSMIQLQCGASTLAMDSEGNITLEGVAIKVIGSSRVDINP